MEHNAKLNLGEIVKEKVYYIKGRYDNITVLPIEEIGKYCYSLTVGKPKNSVLIVAEDAHGSEIISLLLLKFFEEAVQAASENKSICGIFPKRLFEKVSLSLIPYLPNSNTTKEIIGLCSEWNTSRFYSFSTGEGSITTHLNENSPTQCRLMAKILSNDIDYKSIICEESLSSTASLFASTIKKPSFEIAVTPPDMEEGEAVSFLYRQLREMLILLPMI